MLAFTLLSAWTTIVWPHESNTSLHDVAVRCLRSRDSISHMHASINLNVTQADKQSTTLTKFEIWLTPDHFRVDLISSSPGLSGTKKIFCHNCERPAWCLHFVDESVVSLLDCKGVIGLDSNFRVGIDPKLLGMSTEPYPYLINVDQPGWKTLQPLLRSPEYINKELLEPKSDTSIRMRVTHKRTTNVYELSIDPNLGHALTQIKGGRTDSNGETVSYLMQATGHRNVYEGIWYPERIRTTSSINGKPYREEDFHITVHSCNQPISRNVFSVSGMHFSNGVRVTMPNTSRENYVIWHDKIVTERSLATNGITRRYDEPVQSAPPPTPTNPEVVAQPFRWYYIAAAVLFSCIAVYFFRRMLNRG